MPFRVALSGLNAASADLNVTANNIANANTVGFKGSRALFADVFAVGAQEIGNGVRLSSVMQEFGQGGTDLTDRALDLAISGEGFFTLNDGGQIIYSRVGSFDLDRDGYVVNNQGQRLQVFAATANGTFNTGSLSDLRISTTDSPPQATTSLEFGVNLPGDAAPPAIAVFDPANPSSYNHSTPMTIYDSLGTPHTVTAYFVRTANPNEWDAHFYVDGNAVGGANAMTYSGFGVLTTPASGEFALPAYDPGNGAEPLTLTVNLAQSTQFGSAFGVNGLSQDGFASGRFAGVDVDESGVLFARFTNGRSEALGQVALSNFTNLQGLRQLGDTSWAETFSSGDAIRGAPGTASFGQIQSGALESSNVDLTQQLVNMITAQRNFQANAQVISTADQVTQAIINLR